MKKVKGEARGLKFRRLAMKYLGLSAVTEGNKRHFPTNASLLKQFIDFTNWPPESSFDDVYVHLIAHYEKPPPTWHPKPFEVKIVPLVSPNTIRQFYDSWEWKRLRYDFLKGKKRTCQCCGASAADGAKIVIDHIKPIRHHWRLRLDPDNLQILCDDCNMGKGSRDQTDWRA